MSPEFKQANQQALDEHEYDLIMNADRPPSQYAEIGEGLAEIGSGIAWFGFWIAVGCAVMAGWWK